MPAPPAANHGWDVASPENPLDRLCGLGARIESEMENNIHAVLVVRHGKLVFGNAPQKPTKAWPVEARCYPL